MNHIAYLQDIFSQPSEAHHWKMDFEYAYAIISCSLSYHILQILADRYCWI